MFRSLKLIVFFTFLSCVCHAAPTVENPGFEAAEKNSVMPASWKATVPGIYSRNTAVARSGRASLKFVNSDPAKYVLATQWLHLKPGRMYELKGWVKTENVTGPTGGITIGLESYRDKVYLGGTHPGGIKGTQDWTPITFRFNVPGDATTQCLVCYASKGASGTAWFDDLSITPLSLPLLQGTLLQPAYRGQLAEGDRSVRFRLDLNTKEYGLRPENLKITVSFSPADKTRPLELSGNQAGRPIEFQVGALPVGNYKLNVSVSDRRGGKALATWTRDIERPAAGYKPGATIDEHRRLLVDGKPVFPLGMYWDRINEEDLKIYADSKFNCLLPYRVPTDKELDMAQRYGLKVIYSLKDFMVDSQWRPSFIKSEADEEPNIRKYVRHFRNHPAVLAWYIADEPKLELRDLLARHYEWIKAEDPNHPVWMVHCHPKELGVFAEAYDIAGADPYPISKKPYSEVSDWTRIAHDQVNGLRPVWMVPQAFDWGLYEKTEEEKKKRRHPTYEELRSMSWQCICEGATGLVYFSYYCMKRPARLSFAEQWEPMKKVAAEIDAVKEILLSVEPVPEVTARGGAWLHWIAKKYNGKLYIMAVSDGEGEGEATFTLKKAIKSVKTVNGSDRTIVPTGSGFSDNFKKHDVNIYEIEM